MNRTLIKFLNKTLIMNSPLHDISTRPTWWIRLEMQFVTSMLSYLRLISWDRYTLVRSTTVDAGYGVRSTENGAAFSCSLLPGYLEFVKTQREKSINTINLSPFWQQPTRTTNAKAAQKKIRTTTSAKY